MRALRCECGQELCVRVERCEQRGRMRARETTRPARRIGSAGAPLSYLICEFGGDPSRRTQRDLTRDPSWPFHAVSSFRRSGDAPRLGRPPLPNARDQPVCFGRSGKRARDLGCILVPERAPDAGVPERAPDAGRPRDRGAQVRFLDPRPLLSPPGQKSLQRTLAAAATCAAACGSQV